MLASVAGWYIGSGAPPHSDTLTMRTAFSEEGQTYRRATTKCAAWTATLRNPEVDERIACAQAASRGKPQALPYHTAHCTTQLCLQKAHAVLLRLKKLNEERKEDFFLDDATGSWVSGLQATPAEGEFKVTP